MNWWQAAVLAIVEGVTEFLPISSTGHLILVIRWMRVEQTDFVKSFEIAIQLGAILAVVWLYKNRLVNDIKLFKILSIAFIPTGLTGILAYGFVKEYLIGNIWVTVVALGLGGVVMIGFEKLRIGNGKLRIENLSYGKAILIGLVQSVAMIPGVSRALATILGGMGVGLSRSAATEFSFLLAIPTMTAATGYDLLKSGSAFSRPEWGTIILGFVIAFIVALASVKWLIAYILKHDFTTFGVYRIVVAMIFVWMFL